MKESIKWIADGVSGKLHKQRGQARGIHVAVN